MVIIADGPLHPAQRAKRQPLDPHAQQTAPDHGHGPRPSPSTPTSGHPLSRVDWPVMPNASSTYIATNDPHHEHVEVGEVDQLHDPVDQGEAEGDQRIHRPQADPVDDLLDEEVERGHAAVSSWGPRRCSGIAPPTSSSGSLSSFFTWKTADHLAVSGRHWRRTRFSPCKRLVLARIVSHREPPRASPACPWRRPS